jgi:hypothetical protein
MMNLFEIMQAAQGGRAVDNLSSQFGLSPQQTQGALEALLPAFSMGLQRQTQAPDMFSQLAGMMTGGQGYQQAFEDANNDGIPDHLQQQGNAVLGQLFGTKDVSRAVAQQASAMSGVSDSILKAMLPVVASMLMGGLSRSANNQGFGDILGQLAGGMMGGGQQGQANHPLGGLIGAMFGGGQQGAGANPMGGLMGAVLGGMMGKQGQTPAQNANFDPAGMGLEALTKMFDTGRNVQEQHQANLQNIFDAFLKR